MTLEMNPEEKVTQTQNILSVKVFIPPGPASSFPIMETGAWGEVASQWPNPGGDPGLLVPSLLPLSTAALMLRSWVLYSHAPFSES